MRKIINFKTDAEVKLLSIFCKDYSLRKAITDHYIENDTKALNNAHEYMYDILCDYTTLNNKEVIELERQVYCELDNLVEECAEFHFKQGFKLALLGGCLVYIIKKFISYKK